MSKMCSAHIESHYLYLPQKKEGSCLQIQPYNINKHEYHAHNYLVAMLTEKKSVYKVKINDIQKVSHRHTFQIKISVHEHIGQPAGQAVQSHELSFL